MSQGAGKTGASKVARTKGALGGGARVREQKRSWVRELWEELKPLLRPLLAYWLFLGTMFGAFCAAAFWDSPSAEDAGILLMFAVITFGSVGLGQVLALLRIRDWVVYGYWAFMWTVGLMFGVFTAMAVGPLAIFIIFWVLLGPMFTLGGVWSLRVGRGVYASWVPMVYATGTAIIVAESKGKVGEWMEGNKWVIWDVVTFSVLALGIALMLAYLVSRETHRLHLWRNAASGPLKGSVALKGSARPRLSCLGWVMLLMLSFSLSVGTAVIAPYLWRTAPAEEGDGNGGNSTDQDGEPKDQEPKEGKGKGKGKGKDPKGKRKPAKNLEEGVENAIEEIYEGLPQDSQQGLDLLSTLITMFLLFLAGLFIFWRPARRLITVRHLQEPFWKVSQTRRIEQSWRLVEIALADVGVEARPNEPAVSLIRRARPLLDEVASGYRRIEGLEEAAMIRDRVAFGLGMGPDDVRTMEKVSRWAFETVWDRLGDRGQVRAIYRGLG